jgi:hypothetical protein
MLPDPPQKERENMPEPTEAAAGEPEQPDAGAVTENLGPARPGGTQPGFVGAFVRTARRGHAGSVPARVTLAIIVVVVAAAAVVISGALLHGSSVKLTSASGSAGGQADGTGASRVAAAAGSHSPLRPSARPRPAAPVPAPPAFPAQPGAGPPVVAPPASAPKPKAAPGPARPAARHTPAPPPTIVASGEVTCQSGSAVEGVWVVSQDGQGTGWAQWSAAGSSSASFSRTIDNNSWQVHVGCGGSPQSWKVSTFSSSFSGTPQDITCDDISGQSQFGECWAG